MPQLRTEPVHASDSEPESRAAVGEPPELAQTAWQRAGPPPGAVGATNSWLYVPLLHAAAGRLCAHSLSHWRADGQRCGGRRRARSCLPQRLLPHPPFSLSWKPRRLMGLQSWRRSCSKPRRCCRLARKSTLGHPRSVAGGRLHHSPGAQEVCLQVFGGLRFASAIDRHANSFRLPPAPAWPRLARLPSGAALPRAKRLRLAAVGAIVCRRLRRSQSTCPNTRRRRRTDRTLPGETAAPRRRRRRPRRTHGTAPGPGPAAAGPHGDDTDSTLSSVARALDHAAARRAEVELAPARRPAASRTTPAAGRRCWTERAPFNLACAPRSCPRRPCVRPGPAGRLVPRAADAHFSLAGPGR